MDVTVVANQTFLGQIVQNVMVFGNLTTDPTDLQEFADNYRAYWSSLVAPLQNVNWRMDNLTFIFNESLPIWSTTLDFSLGVLQGGSANDPLPTQVSLLVSTKYVGIPPNRGRVYFAGLTEGSVTNGIFNVGAYGQCEALVQQWIDGVDLPVGNAFLRIARRNPNGTIAVTSPAQIAIGRDIPAIQRRRRIGVGL